MCMVRLDDIGKLYAFENKPNEPPSCLALYEHISYHAESPNSLRPSDAYMRQ